MAQLLTIGTFARRCGLSRSALRFYDECGLLRPVAVDDATGYRYYAWTQIDQANLIRRLRRTDMPVEGVRAFLAAGPEARRSLLAAQVGLIEDHLGIVRQAADELRASLDLALTTGTPSCVISGRMLAAAIAQVAFAAAKDGDRQALTGILLEAKDDSLRLVATDRFRLAIRDVIPDQAMSAAPLRALVSAEQLEALRPQLAEVDRCCLGQAADGGLDADLDGPRVTLPPLSGDFPDYEQVLIGTPVGHRCLVGRQALTSAFEGLDAALATIRFSPTKLHVDAEGRHTVLPTRWDGGELAITINAEFMVQAVGVHVGPEVAIEAVDPLRPLTLRSADAGTLSVLVMPVRVDP
jgi:DNA polymerase-3 subunit beta